MRASASLTSADAVGINAALLNDHIAVWIPSDYLWRWTCRADSHARASSGPCQISATSMLYDPIAMSLIGEGGLKLILGCADHTKGLEHSLRRQSPDFIAFCNQFS